MSGVIVRPPSTEPSHNTGWLGRAWLGVALIPLFFFLAFALAEGLYSLTGHDPSNTSPPHWADIAAMVPAGIVFAVPCAAATIYGRRAARDGQRSGVIPMLIGIGAVVAFALLCAL